MGDGANTLFVEGTQLGVVNIFGGDGNDTFNIASVSATTFIEGQAGNDTFNVNFDEEGRQTFENGIHGELTVTGARGSDSYNVGLAGEGSSVINVLDESPGDDLEGVDQLRVLGTNNDDYFLLRANPASEAVRRGMVAAIEVDENQEPLIGGGIERVNYDGQINAGLIVQGRDGDDTFVLDDNLASTVINGDAGDDTFQVGQVFASPRDGTNPSNGLAPEDFFDTTPITRGYLSNGISSAATLNGGFGNDDFTVYRNRAELFLFGDEDDDTFTVRAFVKVDPEDPDAPFTNVNGGQGADFIAFTVNAPVRIDGGDGFDTLTIVGTEFGDDFVVTSDGVFGAGLFVTFGGIEKLTVDALEGNDRFFISSTSEKVAVEVVGGLGSDTFNIGGGNDGKAITVVSNNLGGHSGLVINTVTSEDTDFNNIFVQDLSVNVVDNDEASVLVDTTHDRLLVFERPDSRLDALTVHTYTVVLTRSPDETVKITAAPVPLSERFEKSGAQGIVLSKTDDIDAADETAVNLIFDRTNWFVPQTVYVFAPNDSIAEGSRSFNIQHSLSEGANPTDGGAYDSLPILGVVVEVIDDDVAEVVVVETDDDTTVSEGDEDNLGDNPADPAERPIQYDTYSIVLSRAPSEDVTIAITRDGQPTTRDRDDDIIGEVTFTPTNWSRPKTIRVRAIDDFEKEGLHYTRIGHALTSSLDEFLNIGLTEIAEGLALDINGNVDERYLATVINNTLTIENDAPFTVDGEDEIGAITSSTFAATEATVTFGGAVEQGDQFTVRLSGKDFTVTAVDGDIDKVATALFDSINADEYTALLDTLTTPGSPVLTITRDLQMILLPFGISTTYTAVTDGAGAATLTPVVTNESTTHRTSVTITLTAPPEILKGDRWALTLNDDPQFVPTSDGVPDASDFEAVYHVGQDHKSLDLSDVAAGVVDAINNDPTEGLTASGDGRVITIVNDKAFTLGESPADGFTSTIDAAASTLAFVSVDIDIVSVTPFDAQDTFRLLINEDVFETQVMAGETDLTGVADRLRDAIAAFGPYTATGTGINLVIARGDGAGFALDVIRTSVNSGDSESGFILNATADTELSANDEYIVAVLTLSGSDLIVEGDSWVFTVDAKNFGYQAERLADETRIAAIDVAITDNDSVGVFITETGGDTNVVEPSNEILLGSGVTDEGVRTTEVVVLTKATAFSVTSDFGLIVIGSLDDGKQAEIAFVAPSIPFEDVDWSLTVDGELIEIKGADVQVAAEALAAPGSPTDADYLAALVDLVIAAINTQLPGNFASVGSDDRTTFQGSFGVPIIDESNVPHASEFEAQNVDSVKWNDNPNSEIALSSVADGSVPHLTIRGTIDDATSDFYEFEITDEMFGPTGMRVSTLDAVFDIDHGYEEGDADFWVPFIILSEEVKNGVRRIGRNELAYGSLFNVDTGSDTIWDTYLNWTFDQTDIGKTFFIEVRGIALADDSIVDYELHLSIEGHAIDGFVFAPEPVLEDETQNNNRQRLTSEDFFTFFDPEVGDGTTTSSTPYVRIVASGDGIFDESTGVDGSTVDRYQFAVNPDADGETIRPTSSSVRDTSKFYKAAAIQFSALVTDGDFFTVGLRYKNYSVTASRSASDTDEEALHAVVSALADRINTVDGDRYTATAAGDVLNIVEAEDGYDGFNLAGAPITDPANPGATHPNNNQPTPDLEEGAPVVQVHNEAGTVTRSTSLGEEGATLPKVTSAKIEIIGSGADGEVWTLTIGGVSHSHTIDGTETANSIANQFRDAFASLVKEGSRTLRLTAPAGATIEFEISGLRPTGRIEITDITPLGATEPVDWTVAELTLPDTGRTGEVWNITIEVTDSSGASPVVTTHPVSSDPTSAANSAAATLATAISAISGLTASDSGTTLTITAAADHTFKITATSVDAATEASALTAGTETRVRQFVVDSTNFATDDEWNITVGGDTFEVSGPFTDFDDMLSDLAAMVTGGDYSATADAANDALIITRTGSSNSFNITVRRNPAGNPDTFNTVTDTPSNVRATSTFNVVHANDGDQWTVTFNGTAVNVDPVGANFAAELASDIQTAATGAGLTGVMVSESGGLITIEHEPTGDRDLALTDLEHSATVPATVVTSGTADDLNWKQVIVFEPSIGYTTGDIWSVDVAGTRIYGSPATNAGSSQPARRLDSAIGSQATRDGTTLIVTSANGDVLDVGDVVQAKAGAAAVDEAESTLLTGSFYAEAEINFANETYRGGKQYVFIIDGVEVIYLTPDAVPELSTTAKIAEGVAAKISLELAGRYAAEADGSLVTISDVSSPPAGSPAPSEGDDPFRFSGKSDAAVRALFDIDHTSEVVEVISIRRTLDIFSVCGFFSTCTTQQEETIATVERTVAPVLRLYRVNGPVFDDLTLLDVVFPLDPGSTNESDPFKYFDFTEAGNYIIEVGSSITYKDPVFRENPFSIFDVFRWQAFEDAVARGVAKPADQPFVGVQSGLDYQLIISLPGQAPNENQLSLVGKTLTFIEGPAEGKEAIVTAYDPRTQTFVLSREVSPEAVLGDKFELTFDPYNDSQLADEPDAGEKFGENSPITDTYDVVLTGAPESDVTVNVTPAPTRTFNTDLVFDPDSNYGQAEEVQVVAATRLSTVELNGVPGSGNVWTVDIQFIDVDAGKPVVNLPRRTVDANGDSVPDIESFSVVVGAGDDLAAVGAALAAAINGHANLDASYDVTTRTITIESVGANPTEPAAFITTAEVEDDTLGTVVVDDCFGDELQDRRCDTQKIEPPFRDLDPELDGDVYAIELGGFPVEGENWSLKVETTTVSTPVGFREGPADIARRLGAMLATGTDYDILVVGRVITVARKDSAAFAEPTVTVDRDKAGSLTVRSHLLFTSDNWNDAQEVVVLAVDDNYIDGGDALVFPAFEERVNAIRGPLTITGGLSKDGERFLNDPFRLPGETNVVLAEGYVGDADTVDADPESDGVLTDVLADHVNRTTGERPGFDPRMNDFPFIVSVLDPDTKEQRDYDVAVDGVSADILSLANPGSPFSVGAFTNAAGTQEGITFRGLPEQVVPMTDIDTTVTLPDAGVRVGTAPSDSTFKVFDGGLNWTQATIEFSGTTRAFVDDPDTVSMDTPETWLIELDGEQFGVEMEANSGAISRIALLLAQKIDASPNWQARVTIGLLGEARMIVARENAAAAPFIGAAPFTVTVKIQAENDFAGDPLSIGGDVAIGGTPQQDDAASLSALQAKLWKQVGYYFDMDAALGTGVWTINADGKVFEATDPSDIEDLTAQLATDVRLKAAALKPVVSGTQVILDDPWGPEGVPALVDEYAIRPLNPNERVKEVDQVDTINVFHGNSPADDVGHLTRNRLTGLGMGGDTVIAGLELPGGITYDGIEELDIELGSGNNRFTIESTHEGSTVISTGDGYDTFNVRSIFGHTEILTGGGNDVVNVGSGVSIKADGIGGGSPERDALAGDDARFVDPITALLTIDAGEDRLIGRATSATSTTLTDTNAELPVGLASGVNLDLGRTTVDIRTQAPIGDLEIDVDESGGAVNALFTATDEFDDFDVFVFNYRLCDADDGSCTTYVVSIDRTDLVRNAATGDYEWMADLAAEEERAAHLVDLVGATIELHRLSQWDGTTWNAVTPASGDEMPETPAANELFELTSDTLEPADLRAGLYKWNATSSEWELQNPASGELFDFGTNDVGADVGDLYIFTQSQQITANTDETITVEDSWELTPAANEWTYTVSSLAKRGDVLSVDDSDDDSDNTVTITQDTITGLDMPSVPEIQSIFVKAESGTYRLVTIDGNGDDLVIPMEFAFTAEDFERQLRTYYEFEGIDVTAVRDSQSVTYTVSFVRSQAGTNFDLLEWDGDDSTLIAGDDSSVIIKSTTERQGRIAPIAEIQVVRVTASDGSFVLVADGYGTEELGAPSGDAAVGVTRTDDFGLVTIDIGTDTVGEEEVPRTSDEALAASLNQLFGFTGISVTQERVEGEVTYTITFGMDETGFDVPTLKWDQREDKNQLVVDGVIDPDVAVETVINGKKLNNLQTLRVEGDGTFTITVLGETTVAIDADASAEQLARALEPILNPNNGNLALPFTNNVRVSKFGNVFHITFQGDHRHLWIDPENIDATGDVAIELADRVDGISYYGVETLNIEFGEGDDVANVQGTSATTNLQLNDGNDRIYVSSEAAIDNTSDTDFLTGTLDDIDGLLNIRGGAGSQRLLISDEGALEGDTGVLITDSTDAALALDPTVPGSEDELDDVDPGPAYRNVSFPDTDSEIYIVGLSEGSITFSANRADDDDEFGEDDGDYIGGVGIWTGFGDDEITFDGAHTRSGIDFGGLQTFTTLNTGLGNDVVNVDIDEYLPGTMTEDDGRVIINTQGPFDHELILDPGTLSSGDHRTNADTVEVLVNSVALDPSLVVVNHAGDRVLITDGSVISDGDDVEVVITKDDGTATGMTVTVDFTGPQAVDEDSDFVSGAASTQQLIVFGGQGDDTIVGGTAENILFGDRGRLLFHSIPPGDVTDELKEDIAAAILAGLTDEEAAALSDDDLNAMVDDVFDALSDDELEALTDAKLESLAETVFGHGGAGDRTNGFDVPQTYAFSVDPTIGGDDTIIGSQIGNDIALGGQGDDTIDVGTGDNIAIGDSGRLEFSGGLPVVARTIAPAIGGVDTIRSSTGVDIVLGGIDGDTIETGSNTDVVVGDNGVALFDIVAVNGVPTSVLAFIESTDTDLGGDDVIDVGEDNDVVIAGVGNDRVGYTAGADPQPIGTDSGADVILGDNGRAEFSTETGVPLLTTVRSTAVDDGGDDFIFAADGPDTVLAGSGDDVVDAGLDTSRDVVLGDNGKAFFDLIDIGGVLTPVLQRIASTATDTGGVDEIVVGDGDDVVIAGFGGDFVNFTNESTPQPVGVDSGADVILGDSGQATFDTVSGESLLKAIYSTAPEHGGDDFIFASDGPDTVLAGSGNDIVDAGTDTSRDVVLGDNGRADFDIRTIGGVRVSVLEKIASTATDIGGVDEIVVGDGDDVVIAGFGGDFVNFTNESTPQPVGVDSGADVILGDSGEAEFDTSTGESLLKAIFSTAPEHGGDDFIFASDGPDTVLAGSGNDIVDAGTDTSRDVVLGDNGRATFDIREVAGALKSILATIESEDTAIGGSDQIVVGDGDDVVIAGVGDDFVNFTAGADPMPIGVDEGADVIVGDNGFAAFDTTSGESLLTEIRTTSATNGGDDLIFAGNGPDTVFGGSGNDFVDAGLDASRDVVLGDNGSAEFDLVEVGGMLRSVLATIASTSTSVDTDNGKDIIIVGDGDDLVIAGVDDDMINYVPDSSGVPVQVGDDTGADVFVGDSGRADFDTSTGESLALEVKTTSASSGSGDDLIFADEGPDIVIGGSGNDIIDAGLVDDARDIVLGDNGAAAFDLVEVGGVLTAVLRKIRSTATNVETDNGKDNIVVGDGDDVVIAGVDDDRVNYSLGANPVPVGTDDGVDVILGDSGQATFDTSTGVSLLTKTNTVRASFGGADLIFAADGPDVVIGGSDDDTIDAGLDTSNDVVLGDNGRATFDLVMVDGTLTSLVTKVQSTATSIGGKDTIIVGDGDDVVIAGIDDDLVNYVLDPAGVPVQVGVDSGNDVVIGDNGKVDFHTATGTPLVILAETTAPESRGDDFIFVDNGTDLVLAGSGHDYVDAENVASPDAAPDVVLGDNGIARFDLVDVGDGLRPVLSIISSTATDVHTNRGEDTILVGDGDDVVIAGVDDDLVNYVLDPTSGEPVQVGVDSGDDVVIGDSGEVEFDTTTGVPLIVVAETTAPEFGGNDFIFVDNGADVVLAGSRNDYVDAENEADPDDAADVVLGDNGIARFDLVDVGTGLMSVLRVVSSTATDVHTNKGKDTILVGDGDDVVIAGVDEDLVNYVISPVFGVPVQVGVDDGDDIVIGDSGKVEFDTSTGISLVVLAKTLDAENGRGNDLIFVDNGNDLVLGGSGGDVIDAESDASPDEGVDIVLGDNGSARFDLVTVRGALISVLRQLASSDTDVDTNKGKDIIIVGDGDDIVIAGVDDDLVNYVFGPGGTPTQVGIDDGDDLVIGDSGKITFHTATGASLLTKIETVDPENGPGDDFIFTAQGSDIVLGGSGSDFIDTEDGTPTVPDTAADTVFGDNGVIEFDLIDRADIGLGRGLFPVMRSFRSTATAIGGDDTIVTGNGPDVVIAGVGNDLVNYVTDPDTGEIIPIIPDRSNDLVIGDNGEAVFDTNIGLALVADVFATAGDDEGRDFIFVGDGSDIVISGSAQDTVSVEPAGVQLPDPDVVVKGHAHIRYDTSAGRSALVSVSLLFADPGDVWDPIPVVSVVRSFDKPY